MRRSRMPSTTPPPTAKRSDSTLGQNRNPQESLNANLQAKIWVMYYFPALNNGTVSQGYPKNFVVSYPECSKAQCPKCLFMYSFFHFSWYLMNTIFVDPHKERIILIKSRADIGNLNVKGQIVCLTLKTAKDS